MQPTMCSRCHKNVAVIFITKLEGGETKNEGLCLKCARELGIKPIDDMMKKMGISDEDLDNLTNEMMSAFGGAEGMEGLISVAELVVSCAVLVVLQQKIVDLERRINPEKRGSVYDVHFQKKWMASCDEAEQRQMGQAAHKAFVAATYVCFGLWLALFFLDRVFDTGLLPMVLVLVILGVMQVTYTLECIRLSRKGGAC